MRAYAEELIDAWLDNHPGDELILFGGAWAKSRFGARKGIGRVVSFPNDAFPLRMAGQFIGAAATYYATHSDALISISPLVSPFVRTRRTVVVVHDWRHIGRPEEFGLPQRVYRRLWRWSVNRAGAAVAVSEKTLNESLVIAAKGRHHAIASGRDHARLWDPATSMEGSGVVRVTTFGHHSNKRPELVVEALGVLRARGGKPVQLVILGAAGDDAARLMARAAALGVAEQVSLPGFVTDPEYRATIQTSALVILASSDEGFGLPVAEAEYFGIPAIVMEDSGLSGIHPSAIVSKPDPESLAEAMRAGLERGRRDGGMVGPTWAETAGRVRAVVRGLVEA
jgi:glycosyltransferase involved in cell wall biosynthesis